MNGKQARKLRKLVSENVPSLPERSYERINEREKLFPVGTNVDGTTKFFPVMVGTVVLDNCKRRLYQKSKPLHHAYHGRA